MTTHRCIQVSNILDNASSQARVCRAAASNLLRINNVKGSNHMTAKAVRLERIASSASRLLERDRRRREELTKAIDDWSAIANSEDAMADFYESNGLPFGSVDTYRYRAEEYRRVVKSLQIELDTGIAVCACHFKPFGRNGVLSNIMGEAY